jgi:hypothetical protein
MLSEVVGHIRDPSVPNITDAVDCDMVSTCAANHGADLDRSCRYADDGTVHAGKSATYHDHGMATILAIAGRGCEETSLSDWTCFTTKLARLYADCRHTLTGIESDVTTSPYLVGLVEHLVFLGDKVTVCTRLDAKGIPIHKLLSVSIPEQVRFEVAFDPSAPGFDWLKFLGKARLIHERGFNIMVLMRASTANVYLHQHFFDKFSSFGIGFLLDFRENDNLPPNTMVMAQSIMASQVTKNVSRTTEDAFNGL